MKLPIPLYGQRDERWKDKKLGGGGSIGSYGCLLTCHAMALTYFKHEVTPDVLNEIFKSKGCYDGNNLNFYAIGNVYGDYKAVEYYDCQSIPCYLDKIDQQLAKKMPVIAMVDFDQNPSTKGDWHFVLIIGKEEDGSYYIHDPWYNETYYFHAKYGDPVKNIYGLRIYEGNPPSEVNYDDIINDLRDKVKSLNEQVASLSLENNTLRTDLETQEKDNEDLASQLSTARSERDTIQWENDKLNAKVKTLTEEVTQLTSSEATKDTQIAELSKNVLGAVSNKNLVLELVKRITRRK